MSEPQVYRKIANYDRIRNSIGVANRRARASYILLSPEARNIVRLRLIRRIKKRQKDAGSFPTSSEIKEQINMRSGHIRFTGQARDDLLGHVKKASEIDAAQYIWNNPSELSSPKYSPLGEGKDMTLTKNQRNVQKKKDKGITNFVSYSFKYKGKTWKVKTAQHKRGYETIYHIE